MRLIHLSDLHIWRWPPNLASVLSKRIAAVLELALGRARAFRRERLPEVVERVASLRPDHILITGDLTMSSLPCEFAAARQGLAPLLANPNLLTIIPGNHDRYTRRQRHEFERHFGDLLPAASFPWVRPLDADRLLLALDPCRPHWSASGYLPPAQLEAARRQVRDHPGSKLLVACHYPIDAPEHLRHEYRVKRLVNAPDLARWLSSELGPHLYLCGHVHAAWAFRPPAVPAQLCLNPGAPLRHDDHPDRLPGFLEITLEGRGVHAVHHAWNGSDWIPRTLVEEPQFWPA
ncbi:MAG: metallophosphoesterase [Isosphaeraceae bacterium]|jgi:3',5'-cyclic AMP phosphodiesterase CpdA|nr:MAG: metallophosphoesterase [Isosphaeraceae bacterium]